MTMHIFSVSIVAALLAPVAGNVGLRGSDPTFSDVLDGTMDAAEVRAKLNEALDDVLAVGSSGSRRDRVQRVEASIAPTFQSMPKTSPGRLGPQAVRHMVRTYFRKQHGWTIFSLEPKNVGNVSISTGDLFNAKVPALMETVLETREHGRGLSQPEVVALITALERLILDESVRLLHLSYDMNGYDARGVLNATEVDEVLFTYMAVFKIRNKSNLAFDPSAHHRWKTHQRKAGNWLWERTFAADAFRNYNFAHGNAMNAFSVSYTFENVAQMVDGMADEFGSWQDGSCKAMKNALESYDVKGNGRVRVEDFHNIKNLPVFVLNETPEQLRELGALDESKPDEPLVRITNYVYSPQNCGHFSEFFDVCCFSVCDSLLEDLELQFQSSEVEVGALYQHLTKLAPDADSDLEIAASPLLGPDGPRLRKSLEDIAQRHGGKVPIQGRLFATWMHFAFPRDCPLPMKEQTVEKVPVEAMKQVAPQEWASDMDFHMPETAEWVTEDEILLLEDLKIVAPTKQSTVFRSVVRVVAMLSAAAAVVHIGVQYCGSIASVLNSGSGKQKKNDDFELPLRF